MLTLLLILLNDLSSYQKHYRYFSVICQKNILVTIGLFMAQSGPVRIHTHSRRWCEAVKWDELKEKLLLMID